MARSCAIHWSTALEDIRRRVRDIPDFPKPGILFRDLTPVLADPALLRATIASLAAPFRDSGITAVAGMEARGFIFGAAVAYALGAGFIPLRKAGKLPYRTYRAAYALEYGEATLEMHVDAAGAGDRVLLVDDLIATGGTAAASCQLVAQSGAEIAGCAFVIELDALGGRARLVPHRVHALVCY
jgi:adenine phosphoribosyltransferase